MCNNHVKESSETQWKQLARILKSAKSKNVTNNQKVSEKVRKGCKCGREQHTVTSKIDSMFCTFSLFAN